MSGNPLDDWQREFQLAKRLPTVDLKRKEPQLRLALEGLCAEIAAFEALDLLTEQAFDEADHNNHAEAERLFRKSLAMCLVICDESDDWVSHIYTNLAFSIDEAGRPEEAEPLFRKGLDLQLRYLGEDDDRTKNTKNNLAFCLIAQSRFEEINELVPDGLTFTFS